MSSVPPPRASDRAVSAKRKDPVTLARELLAALGQPQPEAANDETPPLDEAAIRARARAAAERMRKARNG